METALSQKSVSSSTNSSSILRAIRNYWNIHIHDLEIATQPVGSKKFFDELAEYRFDKLRYLPNVVDFSGYKDQTVLEVGCGVGIDLTRFAQGGAHVTGIDLAEVSIDLARKNFTHRGLRANLLVMNGEEMQFTDGSFDMVYAHGVLQYTADSARMVAEIHRVLKPGGQAIIMVYNRYSWLNAMAQITKVDLEHEDAPILKKFSIGQVKTLLAPFQDVAIVPERFPVPTRLHTGLKAALYNKIFVAAFQILPQSLVRPTGWHIMAFAKK